MRWAFAITVSVKRNVVQSVRMKTLEMFRKGELVLQRGIEAGDNLIAFEAPSAERKKGDEEGAECALTAQEMQIGGNVERRTHENLLNSKPR